MRIQSALQRRKNTTWLIAGSAVTLIGVSLSYWVLSVMRRSRSIEVEPTIEEMVPGRYRMLPGSGYPGFTFELLPEGVYRAHIDDPACNMWYVDWSGTWELLTSNCQGNVTYAISVMQWPDCTEWYGMLKHADRWYMEVKRSDLTRITPDQRTWAPDPSTPPFLPYVQ